MSCLSFFFPLLLRTLELCSQAFSVPLFALSLLNVWAECKLSHIVIWSVCFIMYIILISSAFPLNSYCKWTSYTRGPREGGRGVCIETCAYRTGVQSEEGQIELFLYYFKAESTLRAPLVFFGFFSSWVFTAALYFINFIFFKAP